MNWGRAFFGLIIVALGSLFLLDNLGVIEDAGQILGDWWPLAVIIGGMVALFANPRHWLIPLLLVGGGTILLLNGTDVVDLAGAFWPAVLIIVGLLVIFGRGLGSSQAPSSENAINSVNLFSGSTLVLDSPAFEGGKIGAIFGGAEVNLLEASLAPGAVLDVFAAFGGVEIAVPRGWRVDINGFPLFGGFDNATSKEGLSADAPHLSINATVLFGGLEVKH